MNNDYKSASELVSSIFNGLSAEGFQNANNFFLKWKEIAGDSLFSHTKVIDVQKGSIIIEVDHPGWSQRLLFEKKRILTSLKKTFPELAIKNIHVRVVSECPTPYAREESKIGEGVFRQDESIEDVEIKANLDESLKKVLQSLKDSLGKVKQ